MSYFSFQPVYHDSIKKMWYVLSYRRVHMKNPLLPIERVAHVVTVAGFLFHYPYGFLPYI